VGEIVGAAVVSHVPPIVLPEEVRRELNDGEEISLVPGLHRLRTECLDRLGADTFVVFDTHWFTLVEMVVTSHERRTGHYTSDELPRGMSAMPYDIPGDPELAEALASAAADHGTWITAVDDPYLPIHYPTVNLLGFLQGDERWMTASTCGTAGAGDFELWGRLLGEAIEAMDRRVVLLASGGLSHRFWPLDVFRDHESSSLENIITPEARAADEAIIARWEAGDHAAVIDGYPEFRAHAPEGLFGHYLMMVGALGGRDCRAPGIAYSDYEAAAGTGQIHMWFERPDSGWTA
jgi:3,4-dihydroxyphenylacetate 2,3-dioxygenase